MWSGGRRLLWLAAAGALAGCAGEPISVASSVVTSAQQLELDKPTPQSVFTLDEVVDVVVYFTWPDVTAPGGTHNAGWNWYRGDKLVSHRENKIDLNSAPAGLAGSQSASALGVGSYKVDTLLDGKIVCTNRFTIKG